MENVNITLILGALLPSLILIGYICFKDKDHPEPTSQLLKAFFLGMLSADLSLLISIPLGWIGAYSSEPVTVLDHLRVAFFGAGLPEETAKLFMLWLALRKNPYFDEHLDAIVYAVCVGMGFAFVENIGYLAQAGEYWIHTGIVRSIISVPGHFVFAVFMGYYYSYAHFSLTNKKLYRFLMLATPIMAHTAFDWILMVSDAVNYPEISMILTAVFLVLFVFLQKMGQKDIVLHLANDKYRTMK